MRFYMKQTNMACWVIWETGMWFCITNINQEKENEQKIFFIFIICYIFGAEFEYVQVAGLSELK